MRITQDDENIIIEGGIYSGEVSYVSDNISYFKEKNPGKKVNILLNSPGGDVHGGIALAQYFNYKEDSMSVVGFGVVASAATYVAALANKFYLYENASMMIHSITNYPNDGLTLGNIDEKKADLQRLTDQVVEVYTKKLERTGKLINGSLEDTKKYFNEVMKSKTDTWLSSKKALELGIVDGLVPIKGSKIIREKTTAPASENQNNAEFANESEFVNKVRTAIQAHKITQQTKTEYENSARTMPVEQYQELSILYNVQTQETKNMGFLDWFKTTKPSASKEELEAASKMEEQNKNELNQAKKEIETAQNAAKDLEQKLKDKESELEKSKKEIATKQSELEQKLKETSDNLNKSLEEEKKARSLVESELAVLKKPSGDNTNTSGKGGDNTQQSEDPYERLYLNTLEKK